MFSGGVLISCNPCTIYSSKEGKSSVLTKMTGMFPKEVVCGACASSITNSVRFLNSQQVVRLLLTCEGILGIIKHKNSQN